MIAIQLQKKQETGPYSGRFCLNKMAGGGNFVEGKILDCKIKPQIQSQKICRWISFSKPNAGAHLPVGVLDESHAPLAILHREEVEHGPGPRGRLGQNGEQEPLKDRK